MRRRTGTGNASVSAGSDPTAPPSIAIRRALEDGWAAFRADPWPLVLFTLLVGSLNLLCQLGIRWSEDVLLDPFGQPEPVAIGIQLLAWFGYALSVLWLWVGLLFGAEQALSGTRPDLRRMLRVEPTGLIRAAGTLGLVLLVLALVMRLAQASAWLLALLQPALMGLPLLAAIAAWVYLLTDQILSLPISVLGRVDPLEAFRRGRAAIDPHWLQALGLTLLLGLLVLTGFLLLLVGLAAALPVASCTLVAAYRQLFDPGGQPPPPARRPRPPLPHQAPRNRD
ncbi:MAG: hypothetical protein VKI63_07785 [Cyanobium sp.]|nr:hypothetical protein [Cyanobium sp.]